METIVILNYLNYVIYSCFITKNKNYSNNDDNNNIFRDIFH